MAGPGAEQTETGGQVSGPQLGAVGPDGREDDEEPSFFTDPKRLLQKPRWSRS